MGILAKPLGYLLTLIYNLTNNYGLSICIFTVVVMFCLYPFYAKQIKSSLKMSEFQPKMKEIQQKYAKDKELMNQKLMELYQKEGVSMYGGCLPAVVQMFVLMSFFALLRNPMAYMHDKMLYAVHESFFWIPDLAQPDRWILPILAAIATFIAFSKSQTTQPQMNGAQNKMMTGIMKYFFPVMILWMARSYPAGLAIYWFGSQVVRIFFNMRFSKWKKEAQENKGQNRRKKQRA